MKRKTAFFYNYPAADGDVYGQGRRERVAALTDLYPSVVHAGNFDQHTENLAGAAIGDEVVRLADCVIAEFEAWSAGRPLRHQVTKEILATMG